MAKFIPTHHKKFIVLISYSYKFQASEPGVFLTNFVSFNADKCQNNRLEGRNINHREHRDKKLKRVRRFRLWLVEAYGSESRLTQINCPNLYLNGQI